MKRFIVQSLAIILPESTAPVLIELQDGAVPIGVEVRPVTMPQGMFLHHLVPCNEKGEPIKEELEKEITHLYEMAWNELYKLFVEQSEQSNVDVMDKVLKGVTLEIGNDVEAQRGTE